MTDKLSAAQTVIVKQAQPAVDTSAYASGDLIGSAVIEFKSALGVGHKERAGLIQSVIILDAAAQAADLDVVFFDGDPTGTTFTDNDAFAPAAADLDKMVGVAAVTDWKSFSANALGQALNLAIPFVITNYSGSLYAALVSRGTPTFAAATDVILRVNILPLL